MNKIISKKTKDFILSNASVGDTISNKFVEHFKANDMKSVRMDILELTRSCILKEISTDIYVATVEVLHKLNPEIISRYLIETIWIIGLSIEKKQDLVDDLFSKEYGNVTNVLIKKNILTRIKLMEKLEEGSLFHCGLISDVANFTRKSVRINTKNIFEQKKYNLLREESEGYSKLIILFSQEGINETNITKINEKILSLIGYFDLDPNRVLDILLSSFENDYYNTNFLQIIQNFNLKAISQILGFKYQSMKLEFNTKVVCSQEPLNENIFIITAQLIKHNLLALADILEHMSPKNEICLEFKENKIALGKATYIIYYSNKDKEKEAEVNQFFSLSRWHDYNQKILLLDALIKVNAWVEVEVLYSLISSYFDILSSLKLCNTLNSLSHFLIENMYRRCSIVPLSFRPKEDNDININAVDAELGENDSSQKKMSQIKKTFELNFSHSKDEIVQKIQNIEDFLPTLSKIFNILSIGLGRDIVLFSKILRIIKQNISYFKNNATMWSLLSDIICKVFLPSLSILEATPNLVNDLWIIVSEYEYQKRYYFYDQWLNVSYYTNPVLYAQLGQVYKSASKLGKTLNQTKDEIRQNGRRLGVLSNSNPCVVFDSLIRQVVSYDNQIPSFISSLSYCSSLSYDIISFVILKILNDSSRGLLEQGTGDMSQWLINLAYLTGAFYKKHHWVELGGLICYIINKVKSGSTLELIILKEIIKRMTGVITQEELSENQVYSYGGGSLLFSEVINDGDYKGYKKSRNALYEFFIKLNDIGNQQALSITSCNNNNQVTELGELTTQETNGNNSTSLIGILIILLGIKKNHILYNGEVNQLKLMSYLYDQIFNSFVQLVDFLSYNSDPTYYFRQFMPDTPPEYLALNYKCTPDVIFFTLRPSLKNIFELSSDELNNYKYQYSTVFETHQALNFQEPEKGFYSEYILAKSFFKEIKKPLWKFVSKELYFIFWALKLKDIYVPSIRYESEVEKYNKQVTALTDENKISNSETLVAKNKKEVEKLKDLIDKLNTEHQAQKKHYELVLSFVDRRKDQLVADIPKTGEITRNFIQFCLYPRMVFSKVDAIYCAKFLVLMINSKIDHFNILEIFIKIIKFIIPCILCVTEYEAQNIGLFLNEFFKAIIHWQDDKVWNSLSLASNHCFSKKLEEYVPITHVYFKTGINSLFLLLVAQFKDILINEDYMSIRNVLIVLNSVFTIFPNTKEMSWKLISSLTKIKDTFLNQYEDLKTRSQRYTDILKAKLEELPPESELLLIKDSKDKDTGKDDKNDKKNAKKAKEKEVVPKGNDNKQRKNDSKDRRDRSNTPETKKTQTNNDNKKR